VDSNGLPKSTSLWLNPRVVIALHSPSALLETGLHMCPPEKSQDKGRLRCPAVRSLRSGLFKHNREKLAYFTYFGGEDGGISLQFRLVGGEGGIRTVGTASLL